MIRTFFATTAIAAVMTAGAIAQDQQPADGMESKPLFSTEEGAGIDTETGFFEADTSQILATDLIGHSVYTGASDDAETVGDINDVIMSPEGTVEAAVIGVGGFLGIGEKEIAVEFEKISWVDRQDGRWLVIDSSREELENAPAFDRTALIPQEQDDQNVAATEEQPAGEGAATDMAATEEQPADGAAGEQTDMAASEEQPAEGQAEQTAEAEDEQVDTEATAAINPDEWQPATDEQLSAENLIGARVYGANDEDIGEIGDVIVTADGKLEAFVVDVGGFLEVGEKPVALDASELKVMMDGEGGMHVRTQFTREQLEGQAEYTEQAYQENRDEILLR